MPARQGRNPVDSGRALQKVKGITGTTGSKEPLHPKAGQIRIAAPTGRRLSARHQDAARSGGEHFAIVLALIRAGQARQNGNRLIAAGTAPEPVVQPGLRQGSPRLRAASELPANDLSRRCRHRCIASAAIARCREERRTIVS